MISEQITQGVERAPQRSLLYAAGFTEDEIKKPLIGVVSAQSEIIPGHMHLSKIAEAVKAGIYAAGGTPVVVPAIGVCDGIVMGHRGMHYSLASRELIADSVETLAAAHCFDGLVLIPNCDKIVPGMVMAALRLNIPAIVCSGGPMLAGRIKGKKTSLSQMFEAVGAYKAGKLDDAGLLQAASIPKLSHIWIDHTAVTYDGLLAVAGNNYIHPVAHVQFTKEQMEHFSQLQREKAKKPVQLDEQAASECRSVLSAFFAEMTEWEQYMEQVGFEDAEAVPRLLAIWEKYVSEKPRLGYRPLALSYSAQGTYNGEEFLDAEQITKNKLYIYTREKNTSFDRRFLMKRVGEGWMIDAVQERLDGWQRTGL